MRPSIKTLLRVGISGGLLFYLIHLANFNQIVRQLSLVNPSGFLLAVAAFFVAVLLLNLRWHILSGPRPGYLKLLKFYFIGFFFNNFLPTTIGGDISRAYNAGRETGQKALSVGTVLLERVIGFLATLTLASISLIWVSHFFHSPKIIYITLLAFLFFLLVIASVFVPSLFRFWEKILRRLPLRSLTEKISDVLNCIHQFRNRYHVLGKAFAVSILGQVFLILMNFILARALGISNISLGYFFLVVPITFVLGLIPSVNGIGVRDSGYVFLLARIGISPAEAVSISFLNTLIPMGISLIGGVLLLFQKREGKTIPLSHLEEPGNENVS